MTLAIAGFILSGLLAIAYGAAFHFLVGGSLPTIAVYLLASVFGFVVGHFIGRFLEIDMFQIGTVYLLTASIGSWAFLIFVRWFLNPPQEQ